MRFTVVAAGLLAAVASAQSETNSITEVISAAESSATAAVSDATSAILSAASSILSSAESAIESATSDATGSTGSTGSVPSATVSIDPAQSSAQSALLDCLKACSDDDVNCKAKCISVPSPDTIAVNQTTECVAQCPQGKGTAADNQAYADCVSGCIAKYYYSSSSLPGATTGSGSSGTTSATPKVTQVESTVTSAGSTYVTSFSTTVAPASTDAADSSDSPASSSTSAGGADMLFTPIGSGIGLFSFLAAFLAL
ncbi:hypothetical protein F4813DRAFT_361696 [Daldinia decipiens]|uniref:uncharacterized protein n=1 Tax=Daldinia decipiens TaxID=326647 RepID=UPI0020C36E04|nr:uncharacterized protein F4813DRAFT_361696 [Daldinia decipiens]KAI1657124.1 hypothetical protein F4813DRAFT_361696 [Daldinia decipiens]